MTIQAARTDLSQQKRIPQTTWLQQAGLFILFLFIAVLANA